MSFIPASQALKRFKVLDLTRVHARANRSERTRRAAPPILQHPP